MVDRHLLDQLEAVLSRLSAPIMVADKDRQSRDNQLADLPNDLTDGVVQPYDEYLCMPIKQPGVILYCSRKIPGAQDLLLLGGALVERLGTNESHAENCFDVYRRALHGELVGAELDALTHEHQLPQNLRRCVLVFHVVHTENDRAFDLLRDLTPLQEKDVLIDMDRHTVALIKDLSDTEEMEEIVQFAQALQETVMSETARQMTVGVGGEQHTVAALRESYNEARRAIEVGRIFQPDESIFVYTQLVLERFLMELPADISAQYHNMLFNRKTTRLFNEEMLYTIDMFFKKDLNLSDTARQLYIHRNTLVYRLDKVQRQTGLDLRSFKDAVTFKILMELKNCGAVPSKK